jgi:26S proteasome regulatory subunit RPN6 N-terminal domain
MADDLQDKLDAAKAELEESPATGIAKLREVLASAGSSSDVIKVKEAAISALTAALADKKDAEGLKALLVDLRPLHAHMPKAKTAKIVRHIIDAMARVTGTEKLQVRITNASHRCTSPPVRDRELQ